MGVRWEGGREGGGALGRWEAGGESLVGRQGEGVICIECFLL